MQRNRQLFAPNKPPLAAFGLAFALQFDMLCDTK
jgi:hypothetical protein